MLRPRNLGPTQGVRPSSRGRTRRAPAAQIEALLRAYDEAVSGLAADPDAAAEDDDPVSRAWLAVVAPGSQLHSQVRSRIIYDGRDSRTRLVPDADGIIFSDVPLDIVLEADGSITWDNCGYAPGVGVHAETGAVIDDRRASTRGHGRALRAGDGRLQVHELVDDVTTMLAPGEPDPCPELAAAARRRETLGDEDPGR